jgi:hypothetical protein
VAVIVATPRPIESHLSIKDRAAEVRALKSEQEQVSDALERATKRFQRDLQAECPPNTICDGATTEKMTKLADRYRAIVERLAGLCLPLALISGEQRAACDARPAM